MPQETFRSEYNNFPGGQLLIQRQACISYIFLINQIGWNNMLMRIFKTRDKLNQAPAIGNRKAKAGAVLDAGSEASAQLPFGEKDLQLPEAKSDRFDPFKVFGPADRGLSEPAAIREPGALTAPRAFKSYENQNGATGDCPFDGTVPTETGTVFKAEQPIENGNIGGCPFDGTVPTETGTVIKEEQPIEPIAQDPEDTIGNQKSEIRNLLKI